MKEISDHLMAQAKSNMQSLTHHGGGACATASMSVLTDPAKYELLSSEMTNGPLALAVLGELAALWQQMVVTLQLVEEEAVPSQNLADAVEHVKQDTK